MPNIYWFTVFPVFYLCKSLCFELLVQFGKVIIKLIGKENNGFSYSSNFSVGVSLVTVGLRCSLQVFKTTYCGFAGFVIMLKEL